jgi:hypothetical protein
MSLARVEFIVGFDGGGGGGGGGGGPPPVRGGTGTDEAGTTIVLHRRITC